MLPVACSTVPSLFDGVHQVEFVLAGEPTRLPVFIRDAGAFAAVFPARLAELRRLLPDPGLVPARIAPGAGAVVVGAVEYRDGDLGAYREVLVGIALEGGEAMVSLPGRAALRALLRGRSEVFILDMPVTTELAREGGVAFAGYPKWIAAIEVATREGERICRLRHPDETVALLTLVVRPPGGGRRLRLRVAGRSWRDGQVQGSELLIESPAVAIGPGGASARLELDPASVHSTARQLDRALLGRRALAVVDVPAFRAIFFGPERITARQLERLARARADERART